MSNLPGLMYDENFLSEIEFLIAFHKTFRCYYISLFYLSNKKYKEAVGFFFRVENYVRKVESNLASLTKDSKLYEQKESFVKQKDILVKDLNQSKYKIQTAAILESEVTENEERESLNAKLNKIVSEVAFLNWTLIE